MKKKILLSIIIIMLIVLPVSVCYAGSIPEDLLGNDNAQLYFGEILDYSENTKSAAVSPVKNIKGDIVIGSKQTLENCVSVGIKDNIHKRGEVCLIAYYDDVNPIYIFRTTNENIPTLKIKNIEGIDMWERLQQYINEGKYTQAEIQRVNKQGLSVQTYEGINEPQFLLSALYKKEVFIISLILILLYMILGSVKRKWSAIIRIIAGCALALYGLVAAGGAKHYFLYRLYQKWGDVFEEHIREFIPWAIAEYSRDIFILGSIAIVLIIIGATLMKKLGRKHINIYVALSFVGVNIISIVLSFFSINKMFDIGAHITSFAYFVSLWLFAILTIKNLKMKNG